MGCPVVQGYLYGRPVAPDEVLLPAARSDASVPAPGLPQAMVSSRP
jgi:predicted signal transduction protein with EAL and GGDEF domain